MDRVCADGKTRTMICITPALNAFCEPFTRRGHRLSLSRSFDAIVGSSASEASSSRSIGGAMKREGQLGVPAAGEKVDLRCSADRWSKPRLLPLLG
jgi:hypothetical protein